MSAAVMSQASAHPRPCERSAASTPGPTTAPHATPGHATDAQAADALQTPRACLLPARRALLHRDTVLRSRALRPTAHPTTPRGSRDPDRSLQPGTRAHADAGCLE